MTTEQFKKAVREKAVYTLREDITGLEEQIRRYRETDERTLDEGQADISQQAQDDANQEIINELSRQIDFIREKIARLDLLDETINEQLDTVAPGAVVRTDRGVFFVGVGVEEFTVGNTAVTGLDTGAELFTAMEGKKAGDRFAFRGTAYQIVEVY